MMSDCALQLWRNSSLSNHVFRRHDLAIRSSETVYFHTVGFEMLRPYDDILTTPVQHAQGIHFGVNNTPNVN